MTKRKLRIGEIYVVLTNISRVSADVTDLVTKLDSLGDADSWPDNSIERRMCEMNTHIKKAQASFEKVNEILSGN
jgi:hypothetical protein